jgi:hypothetical protein
MESTDIDCNPTDTSPFKASQDISVLLIDEMDPPEDIWRFGVCVALWS